MRPKILWADDEIDLLKAHIMFLDEKGYSVETVTNGNDALDMLDEHAYDIVFLDENMPGLTGLETLEALKQKHPELPVVMITKSEEEFIMEDAIGAKISDYLIKPVNPNQILLTLRKNLDRRKLVSQKTLQSYMQRFREMGMELSDCRDLEDFQVFYEKLVYWELQLEDVQDQNLREILESQKREANAAFARFVEDHYLDWLREEPPLMSHNLFRERFYPGMKTSDERPVILLMIDNLRYDQWRVIRQEMLQWFQVKEEGVYCSILPTATQYARNAFFAGLMPADIKKTYPDLWIDEGGDGSKNAHEEALLEKQLYRLGWKDAFNYNKVTGLDFGRRLADQFDNLMQRKFNVIVYNFVDMLSHARTDMQVIKELADNESAYRSVTRSWFLHSACFDLMKKASESGCRIMLTTDHGTIRVKNPVKVIGDKQTSTNLRYKLGRNLRFEGEEVFAVNRPEDAHLPKENISSSYIFAREEDYFVYPNNYHHFVRQYKNTFQHGGVSMEEMLVPYAIMDPKS